MRKTFYTPVLVFLIAFAGCKTNHSLKCPDLVMTKSHHPNWAKAAHTKHISVSVPSMDNKKITAEQNSALASSANEPTPLELKIPRFAIAKLSKDEVQGVNNVFEKYSANSVKMERNANGKLYLKANSNKDVIKLIKTLAALKKTDPAAAYGDTGGNIALAGGIIGIIAIVLALGPFVSYGAFILGIIAIVLGVVGLRSGRRGWAIAGIVLGVLAILFAGILGIGIYTVVLHI